MCFTRCDPRPRPLRRSVSRFQKMSIAAAFPSEMNRPGNGMRLRLMLVKRPRARMVANARVTLVARRETCRLSRCPSASRENYARRRGYDGHSSRLFKVAISNYPQRLRPVWGGSDWIQDPVCPHHRDLHVSCTKLQKTGVLISCG